MGSAHTKQLAVVETETKGIVPLDTDKVITSSPHWVYFVILDQNGVRVGTETCECPVMPKDESILRAGDSDYKFHEDRPGMPNSGFFRVGNQRIVIPFRYLVRQEEPKSDESDLNGRANLEDVELGRVDKSW